MSTPSGPISFDDLRKEFLTASSTNVNLAQFYGINRGTAKSGVLGLNDLKNLRISNGYLPYSGSGTTVTKWVMNTETQYSLASSAKGGPDGHLHSTDHFYNVWTYYFNVSVNLGANNVQKNSFATETGAVQAVGANIGDFNLGTPSMANSPLKGFLFGGYDISGNANWDRQITSLAYSTDTGARLSTIIPATYFRANGDGGAPVSYGDKIYWKPGFSQDWGGSLPASFRFTVSTETPASMGDVGPSAAYNIFFCSAVQNETHGWHLNGHGKSKTGTSANYSTVTPQVFTKHTKSTEVWSVIATTRNEYSGYAVQNGTTAWTSGNNGMNYQGQPLVYGGFKWDMTTETVSTSWTPTGISAVSGGGNYQFSNMGGWQSGGWY